MLIAGLPLHPIAVHLPVALAALMPLFVAAAWYAWRRNLLPHQIWVAVAALQIILVASGVVAFKTGEQEEERVEDYVAESRIEEHEEHAEAFLWAASVVALIAVGGALVKGDKLKSQLMGLSFVGTLAVAGFAMWTGHAGGELVYKYNAGKAYAPNQSGQRSEQSSDHPESEHPADEDD